MRCGSICLEKRLIFHIFKKHIYFRVWWVGGLGDRKAEEEGEAQVDEPHTVFSPETLRSQPELKPRVTCLTDCHKVPQHFRF